MVGALFVGVSAPSTLSVAAAPAKKAMMLVSVAGVPYISSAATVMFAGAVTSGAVRSTTVIEAEAVPILPYTSCALKLTSVVAIGKIAGALFVGAIAPSTLSVAVAAFKNTVMAASVFAVPAAFVALTVILAGAVTTGAVKSMTVTVAVVVATFFAVSIAAKVTVLTPCGNTAGALFVGVIAPSTISIADAPFKNPTIMVFVAAVPAAFTAATMIFAGALIAGAVVSTTLTVRTTCTAAFPALSEWL